MHFNNSLYNHLIIPFKVQNLLGIDLDPDALLDLGHEHGPGDAPRLVVQLIHHLKLLGLGVAKFLKVSV